VRKSFESQPRPLREPGPRRLIQRLAAVLKRTFAVVDKVTAGACRPRGWSHASILLLLSGVLHPAVCRAVQPDEEITTHWAFSAFFGTGWYQIPDNRSVYIFRIPPRQVLRRSFFDGGTGDRRLGIEIHYPVTLGLVDVTELSGIIAPDNFGTVSFTPGIELEVPVTEKWYLRPLVHAGWGKETSGGNSAWIYYGGVKSRYKPGNGGIDWSLLNGVYFAGYKPEHGASDRLASAMIGTEFRQPLAWTDGADNRLNLDWHLTYTRLIDKAEFKLTRQISESVRDEWELGLALHREGRPIRLWFIDFEHVGLSFSWSGSGDYRAVTLNLKSPFMR
jgi:hypothetical protein